MSAAGTREPVMEQFHEPHTAGGPEVTLHGTKYDNGTLDLTRLRLSVAQVVVVAAILLSLGGTAALTLHRIGVMEAQLAAMQTTLRVLEIDSAARKGDR